MMPLFMKKPLRDLKRQKTKTLLILLSIIISLSIAGILVHTKLQFEAALTESMKESNIPDATFYTNSFHSFPVNLTRLEGVREAEPGISLRARAKTKNGYKNIEIVGLPEKKNGQIGTIQIHKSHSGQSGVYSEVSTKKLFEWKDGQDTELLIPGKKPKSIRLTGTVEDPSRIPASFSGTGYLYLSPDALKNIGVPLSYSQIQVAFEEGTSKSEKDKLISKIGKILKSSGITSYRTESSEETFYIRDTLVSAILTVLICFGFFSLILGFILVSHLFHRVIAEHVKELGIQRTVGAPISFIWKQYFIYLGIIGAISFVCSAAASYYGSLWAVRYLVQELNIGGHSESIHPAALFMLLILSFAIPYLGALIPIQKVLKKPLTDSLRNVPHSFPSKKEKKRAGRFSLSTLSRRHVLSKKGQLLSNIVMLSFGGAVIISCLSLNQTMAHQLQQMNQFWNYDQEWSIKSTLSKSELTDLFKNNSRVSEAEGWTVRNTEIARDETKTNALLTALPEESTLIRPRMNDGQWLKKGGVPSIVINEDLRTMLGNPKIGTQAELQIGKDKKIFTIEGVTGSQLKGPAAYISETDYQNWLHTNTANRMAVQTKTGTNSTAISAQLEKHLTEQGAAIESYETIEEMKERPKQVIGLMVSAILAAGILFTLLGIINLMTAASINVYERQKEIGIIRALGGSSGKIIRLFAGESILTAIISWSLSAFLSIPLSRFLLEKIGVALLGFPLEGGLYLNGMLAWLFAAILIGLAASIVPVFKSLSKPLPKMLRD
ncbi:ABC transporter permease [Bacillus sp. FJAT-42376]|uniref:ABC transporter permease n=1 Tax=Bacillus sp. FJAT-42376 TaxID=2014076 RepID=UPI000F515C42|nr:FtsX-like permease family protein [Bacillus sp. FJAT-42376]AZB44363.1 ABC transporter permease [Bacillus sp. FJAT-42376]